MGKVTLGNQPLKYRGGFGALWQVHHARAQSKKYAKLPCSFSNPNSLKIGHFFPNYFYSTIKLKYTRIHQKYTHINRFYLNKSSKPTHNKI